MPLTPWVRRCSLVPAIALALSAAASPLVAAPARPAAASPLVAAPARPAAVPPVAAASARPAASPPVAAAPARPAVAPPVAAASERRAAVHPDGPAARSAVRLDPPVPPPDAGVPTAAVASARLVNLFWGNWAGAAPVARPRRMDRFLGRLVRSGYFDDLEQYGVARLRFGGEVRVPAACGREAPAVVGPAGVARLVACTVGVSPGLERWEARRALLVDVLLPASTRADFPSRTRCLGSQGRGPAGLVNYHGNTANHTAGPPIPFTVVSAGCAAAAGGGATFGDPYRHLTWALTHEIVEALTDPLPGYGWIDRALGGRGEAADLCEPSGRRVPRPSSPVPFLGGTVTPYWSNRSAACVAELPADGNRALLPSAVRPAADTGRVAAAPRPASQSRGAVAL